MYRDNKSFADEAVYNPIPSQPQAHIIYPSTPRAYMPVNPATLIQIGILSEKDLDDK